MTVRVRSGVPTSGFEVCYTTNMPYSDPKKQRAAQAAYQRRKIAKTREFMKEAKSGPCTDCGEKYPYYVMRFDHVRGKKFRGIAVLAGMGWLAAIKREPHKCELVCANCHAERTWQRKN